MKNYEEWCEEHEEDYRDSLKEELGRDPTNKELEDELASWYQHLVVGGWEGSDDYDKDR